MVTGELRRAAHLFAASTALREATGAPADASNHSEADPALSAVRAGLGDEVFASKWNEGKRMSLEQAIAYALAEPS